MTVYKVHYDTLINHSRFFKYRRKFCALSASLQLNDSQRSVACNACRLDHYLHQCPLFVYSPKRSHTTKRSVTQDRQ